MVAVAGVSRVSGRKLLAAMVVGAAAPSAPLSPPTNTLLHQTTVDADRVPTGYCASNATYRPPPVYVKDEPPENVMSQGPVTFGIVVVALCAIVMPLIAVDHVVLFVFVVSPVFCK